jgi:hypothetical protein
MTTSLLCCLLLACGNTTDPEDDSDGGANKADVTDGTKTDGSTGGDTVNDGDSTADDGSSTADDGTSTAPTNVLQTRSLKYDNHINGVWGTALNDIWWVGTAGLILHDNGKVLAPRNSGTSKDLHAVWGLSADNVWFVGDGVVLQYNGHTVIDRTPSNQKDVVFRAAHAPSDGSTLVIAGDKGIVLRYLVDKNKLIQEQTNVAFQIHGIYAESIGIIWGVGASGQALKLSGGSWSSTTMPKAGNRTLTAIDGMGSRKFVVGEQGYVAATDLETKVWRRELSNDPPPERDLRGVWAVSSKEAWAVGVKGALLHKVGKSWQRTDIDGTYMKTKSFNGVWGIAGDNPFAYAVGEKGAGLRFDGQKWLDYRAETAAHLNAISALKDGRVAACGNAGLLLVAADAKSAFVDLGAAVTGVDLFDVAADGQGGLIAVGKGGVVVRAKGLDGQATVNVSVPQLAGGLDLRGVTALKSGKVLVVGQSGIALVWDGKSWSKEKTGTSYNLRSVSASGKKAFAVGEHGVIRVRADDGTWGGESSGVMLNLNRVLAWGDGEAVVVGDNARILSRKAGAWKSVFEESALFLYGVTRRADGTIIAVGWSGTLVVGKDGVFKKIKSGLVNVLQDVTSTTDGTVAVGYKGGVYQVSEKL